MLFDLHCHSMPFISRSCRCDTVSLRYRHLATSGSMREPRPTRENDAGRAVADRPCERPSSGECARENSPAHHLGCRIPCCCRAKLINAARKRKPNPLGTSSIRLRNTELSAFSVCKLTARASQAKHYLHGKNGLIRKPRIAPCACPQSFPCHKAISLSRVKVWARNHTAEITLASARLESTRPQDRLHGIGLIVTMLKRQHAARAQQAKRRSGDGGRRGKARPAHRRARDADRSRTLPGRARRSLAPEYRAGWTRSDRIRLPDRVAEAHASARAQSPTRKAARCARARLRALSRAVRTASSDQSRPTPKASARSASSASRIQPLPVPRSRIRAARRRLARWRRASATSASVSGRGSRVSGASLKGSPQNSRRPRIRKKPARRQADGRGSRQAGSRLPRRGDDQDRAPEKSHRRQRPRTEEYAHRVPLRRFRPAQASGAPCAERHHALSRAGSTRLENAASQPRLGEQGRLMRGNERSDDLVERLSRDDLGKLVEG